MECMGCKDLWKKLHNSLPVVSDGTKKLVLEEVRRMVEACEGKEDMMRSYSGQCALNPWSGFFKDPTSHVGINFDDKIVSWYFATKMFFSRSSHAEERDYVVEAIRAVSNYMIFLLAERPYMLPSPVRPGLYANTEAACAELDFFDMKHISTRGELDRRRRIWDLDTRTDGDELYRVRDRLDIIREDLDVIREDLDRKREELDGSWDELDVVRLKVGSRRVKLEVLDRRREELDSIRNQELNRTRFEELKKLEELHSIPPPSPPPSLFRGAAAARKVHKRRRSR